MSAKAKVAGMSRREFMQATAGATAAAGGYASLANRTLTEEDFDLYEQAYVLESRKSFWAYRQYIDPGMITGWFPYILAMRLQHFYERLRNGDRPKLLILAPPQHGKSRALQDFISWAAGKNPDLRTIYGSYSNDLGVDCNMAIQRVVDDRDKYGRVFPATLMNTTNVVSTAVGSGRFLRNSEVIQWVGKKGYFRNVTVEGQVSGKSLDLGVIDDPIKGRAEAQSKKLRDKTWAWLMDDFFSRFSDQAGLIMIMTHWHVDDPAARFLLNFPDTEVIRFPAMYEANKPRPYDPRRLQDEPLFPEFKSKDFLLERKKSYSRASWESLYQQSPIVGGGGMFPIAKINIVKALPPRSKWKRFSRYWDKAGTADGGAYTSGVLMLQTHDDEYFVVNIKRGQWQAFDRERIIKATAEQDHANFDRVEIYVEQEPGSGGKESAERTIRNLSGFIVAADRPTGDKVFRADGWAAQVQAGNANLLAAGWNEAYLDELETFPGGTYKDQVDASAGAFNKLTIRKYRYDTSMKWIYGQDGEPDA